VEQAAGNKQQQNHIGTFSNFIPFYKIDAMPNSAGNKLPLSGCSNNV